jgi:hypothetical protein
LDRPTAYIDDPDLSETVVRHTRFWVILLSSAVALLGCSKRIPYEASPHRITGDLVAIMEQLLEQQPGTNAPVELEVTGEKISLVKMVPRGPSLYPASRTVYYKRIGEMEIYFKRTTFRVMVLDRGGHLLYRYVTYDEDDAKKFVDVLWALKQRAAAE